MNYNSNFLSLAALLPMIVYGQQSNISKKPNIVLIMCDDMGYSDISCYGSEIPTPNIDYLATLGTRFSNFKNTGRSCPSRAALLTGYYQHNAGIGWMVEVDEHRPGYRGQISDSIPTIAEVLSSNGYNTYMSGKWHVTSSDSYDHPNGSYPIQRGFQKYYGCLSGGGSYYKPKPLYSGMELITDYPEDFYYTQAITDSAVNFIENHEIDKSMFLYIAHFAPHLPLQAPQSAIEKCREMYSKGFDWVRSERFRRQKELGLVRQEDILPEFQREFNGKKPKWEELDSKNQQKWITDMSTYAAMIEIVDDGVGKIINELKKKGIFENTIFIFLSDNGATNEGGFINQLMADVSNTPYRNYKQWVHNGGISSPLIIAKGDSSMKHNGWNRQFCSIIDLFPTFMDFTKSSYPSTFNGNRAVLQGESIVPFLKGKSRKKAIFFEHQSSGAVIDKEWKLVRTDIHSAWELYNLSTDPFETVDLSKENSKKAQQLQNMWNKWAENNKVLPLEWKPWSKRIRYYKDKYKKE